MAWISEDWDKLGSFLSKGLSAYGSERQRREESRWRQEKADLESQRAEAYIATLNEQMESSRARRTEDARAAERLRTGVGEAWGDGPEDVPLGEMGAYTQWMEGQEPEPGQQEISAAKRAFFPEGLPSGLTEDDFESLIPFLMDERRAARKAELEGGGTGGTGEGGGYEPPNAALIGQMRAVGARMRMDALYGLAHQDPDLDMAIQDATDDMTGEMNWSKIAAYLGPEDWQGLMDATQYLTDEYFLDKGMLTPGAQQRYKQRHYQSLGGVESSDEEEDRRTELERKEQETKVTEGMTTMPTDPELVDYMRRAHPSLGTPGPRSAPNIRALAEDPEALAWMGLDRYQSRGDWTQGVQALEQEARATGREWPGFPSFGEETRKAQAKHLRDTRRRELERGMGRAPRGHAPRM